MAVRCWTFLATHHDVDGCERVGLCAPERCEESSAFRDWLESVLNSNTAYGFSELVLSGFIRVVTHPKIFEKPSSFRKWQSLLHNNSGR